MLSMVQDLALVRAGRSERWTRKEMGEMQERRCRDSEGKHVSSLRRFFFLKKQRVWTH